MMSLKMPALPLSLSAALARKVRVAMSFGLFALVPFGVARAQVSMSPSALPVAAEPGVQLVRVTGNQFPGGTLPAANMTVTLAPATSGAGPTVQAAPVGVARLFGTTATVTFTVPSSLTFATPTPYLVSVSGATGTGAAFTSKNTSKLTIDPPATATLSPATGQQGQSLNVTINGQYSNFTQGATTANFGPGISVGGGAPGAAGPVTVTGPTSATARLTIAANATATQNTVSIATGTEKIAGVFTIAPTAAQPIDLAISKTHTGNFTQGQNATYTIGVTNAGPGATSGTVTVTDTLPSALTLVSMSGSGWSCAGTSCTRSDALTVGSYPSITVVAAVAASAPVSVTNSASVSGGGTDSNPANNTASDTATVAQVAASITASAGTPQSAAINTAFGASLQATVKDAGGNPVSGASVTFAAPTSGAGGSFGGSTTVTTNARGVATAPAFTANGTSGSYTVTAKAAGVAAAANFALTNTAGTPFSVTATAGTPQSAVINTAFGSALQVLVKDAGGNALSGVTVTFTAPATGAGATFASGNTATTGSNGVAILSGVSANATVGAYTVAATVAGVSAAANFSLTNTVGPPAAITASAGTPQSAPINTAFGVALQATVKDAGGNPVSGVTVTFAAPGTGASGSFGGGVTAITGANGVATASTFTANGTAGSYSVTASAAGVTGAASFALTNTVGTPASIVAQSGTPQSAVISTAFGSTLQALVKDSGGNPLSGVTVTFSLPASGAGATIAGGNTAVTGANGVATSGIVTANATVGAYSVTASVSGVSATASFSLTNTVGAAASITATAGTPQSAVIGAAFGAKLQVTVKDAGGNPVAGVTVTFAPPGTGAGATIVGGNTAVTGANGVATSGTVTANATAGQYLVTASVGGVSGTATFSLTNTVGPAASITAIAGTPQSAQVGTAFTTALQVVVKDAGSNLVSGATVTFTSPLATDGTFAGGLLTVTASTNANGVAMAPAFTAGTNATSYGVTASVSGVASPATFALTNTPGAASTITATGGAGQSATVGTAFATNLQATVKDGSGNPVNGITVTFTSLSRNDGTFAGGLLTATALTGTNGIATAPAFTAGPVATNYSVVASATGASSVSFTLTNTAAAASAITAYYGGGQSTIIGTQFGNNLQVLVRDANSNPVGGVTVTFVAPGAGASGTFAGGVTTAVTASNGVATSATLTANSTAGGYNVTATATGVTGFASFALTNTPGVPATLAIYNGNSQSTPVNTAFPTNLSAIVRDSGNNAVSGVTVTFAAPATGASGSFAGGVNTAVTGANGIATAPVFTANATPGSYQVVGSVANVTSQAVYTLTNTQANISVINPTSGTLAQTLNVAITGVSSHFVQGTTTAYFGTGITVNSVTVTSATAATVNITIAPTTALGYRNVTLTTGSEVATYTNGFYVNQGSAAIVSLTPNTAAQGTQASVAVLGTNTNFQQGVTTAYFGQNIGVNSVTVTDLTHATVNITVSGNATIGAQSVSLTTGGEVAQLTNGFSVTNGTAVITTVNPGAGNQGDGADSITISGQATHFVQGTTTASFGTGVTVTSLTVNSATQATAVVSIATTAAIGNRQVVLTTGSEVANSQANAFVVAAGVPSATANPNFGIQGTSPTIVINGNFTSFVQGVTTVTFNDGNIAVGAVTVNGPTQLSVPIAIGTGSSVGNRTITVNTNGNTVTAAFHVVAGMPAITLISPNVGVPNSTVSVHITGNFTNWASGTTQVSFGGGIAVGGGTAGAAGPVTVNDVGDLTAKITIATDAVVGPRTVTVTTGTEVESVNSGFTIETCTTTAPSVILNNPATNASNVPLNPIAQFEFNAPIDRTTVNRNDFRMIDTTTGQPVAGTISVDASGRILTFTPGVLLAVGRQYYLQVTSFDGTSNVKDTCGNIISNSYFYFTTTFSAETAGPVLTGNSPQAGDTVAENAQVVLQFNEPIDPITQPAGFVVSVGGTPVAGTYTPSPDYTQFKFVPGAPLPANTVVTVTTTNALQDGAGNALTNPGSFTFTTTGATDTAYGSVLSGDPYSNETFVSTTIRPTFFLSKQIDPLFVNVGNLYIDAYQTGRRIPATVSVSADRLSVTVTPSTPLQPNTEYSYSFGSFYGDLEGNYFYGTTYYFTTGNTGATPTTTVTAISPTNGQTGAPVNTKVVAQMSAPVDPGNIASAITLKAGGTAVAGTVSLASDQKTLTFTPTANLAVSTAYTVTVGGFLDANQNTVQTATGSFTTGSSTTPQTAGPTLVSVTPANNATGVSNTSPITVTFSEAVDPATIDKILVRDESNGYNEMAGTWALSGSNPAQAIFTPGGPYPANAVIQVYTQNQVQDLAGNTDTAYVVTTFTVAGVVDSSTFQVVAVSPANGTTGVGRNATISITFNKSVNGSTLNPVNALTLFAGDVNVGTGNITYSADGRTISFTQTTPASSTINIDATPLITDLSGNPLVNFTSSYSTIADITGTSPTVVGMLPGNGTSDVLTTTPISIYTNGAALNPATVTSDSFHVSQSGVLVQGTIVVSPGGQTVTFTPASPFAYGALVQVFMLPTVTDVYGNPFSSYTAQFTVQGNPSSVAPQMIGESPVANATGVGTNVLPQMKFDQPLLASSVDSTSVFLFQACSGTQIPGTATVSANDPTILQFTPSSALPAQCNGNPATFYLQINNGAKKVTNLDGVAVAGNPYFYFTVGSGPENSTPTLLSVAPPAGATGVGVNAVIYLQFSEPVNPLSINATTVQIAGAGQTAVPQTIIFDTTGTLAKIQDQGPLPGNTAITIKVNGVTNYAGTAVTPYTSSFTTTTTVTSDTPTVISESVANGATGVPTNTVLSMQFNQPMAPNSFTPSTFFVQDNVTGQHVPATITISADFTTATLTPLAPLDVNRQYYYQAVGVRGVTGNGSSNNYFYFTTQATQSAVLPVVTAVNPTNNLGNIPTNTVVQLLFNEAIAPDTVTGVTIQQNGTPIPATVAFSRGNTLLSVTPSQTLQPNTAYTVSAVGVVDTAGHAQASAFTSNFTTAAFPDLSRGSVAPSYIPEGGQTNVALNIHPTFFFTKMINPISVPQGTFYLQNAQTGGRVPAVSTVSTDQMSVTLVPNQNLIPDTQYYLNFQSAADIAGNYVYGTSIYFTTGGAATTTGASVASISPASGSTGVPLNVQVVAVMSAPVSQNTFGASPITVKAGSTVVPGTTVLAGDEVTLTFTPTSNLAASTAYTVTVGGFEDQNGNAVQTGTSTFTTGTAAQTATFGVVSQTPAPNTTISSNTTPIVITFNEAVDASTVSNILVRDVTVGYNEIAGSFAVNGAVVTFTPLTPYPANHNIQVYVQGSVLSLTGGTTYYVSNFTTANTPDTAAPIVTSVTPVNGSTNVGTAPPIVLTFSKSMNQSTLNTTSIAVFAGDSQYNYSLSYPADGRSVKVNIGGQLPASTLITVSVSAAAQDLSGNALVPFQSQFTTAVAPPTQTNSATVIGQIPAIGATGIAQNTAVTLYLNGTAIDGSTLNSGTLQLSQNGQLVTGNIALIGNGHAIQFTPSAPLAYGALIQIFLNQGVLDTSGYALQSAYTGQFTIQGDPASTAPAETGTNPVANATAVPPNVKPQMRFDQPILASSLNASSVRLYDSCHSTIIAGTPSLASANVVQFTPSSDLSVGTCATYYLQMFGITNTSGTAISGNPAFYFTIAGANDTSTPTVTTIGPPAGTQNVGINAKVYVQFNKPIDELSVTGSTIAITGASQTVVPASITFDTPGTTATIEPSIPLPPSTTMTITINGVTDPEGNTVTPSTSTFTTMAGPDATAPRATAFSFAYNDAVPLNTTAFSITFNKPMDPVSFNPTSFRIYDATQGVTITPVSIGNSSDMMTFNIVIPAGKLNAGDGIYLQVLGVTDITGNVDGNDYVYGTVSSTSDSTAPTVTEVSPQTKLTNVPTNALPQVEFSKEISNVSAQTGVQLLQGSTVVPATVALTRGDTVATITPVNPLAESTQYTISVSGVQDVQGTPMTSAYTSNFTTSASGINLVAPAVVSVTPANGAPNVPANTTPVVVFSAAMDPLNFDPSLTYAVIENNANSVVIPAAVAFSSDGKTVTFTPATALTSGTTYRVYISYYYVTDVAGNRLSATLSSTFTIQ